MTMTTNTKKQMAGEKSQGVSEQKGTVVVSRDSTLAEAPLGRWETERKGGTGQLCTPHFQIGQR